MTENNNWKESLKASTWKGEILFDSELFPESNSDSKDAIRTYFGEIPDGPVLFDEEIYPEFKNLYGIRTYYRKKTPNNEER